MNEAFLSLGGNSGDRVANLSAALQMLENKAGKITQRSGIYETEPWGSDSSWPFLNMVIKLATSLSAAELLHKISRIEKKLERKRTADRNADRTIDIDILYFNREVIENDSLQVPHPRLHLRKFILVPFNEIAPRFTDPRNGLSISKMLKQSDDQLSVVPFKIKRNLKRICIEGNIGTGKTSLCTALAKKLKAGVVLEKFEDNQLLPLFYQDPSAFALPLEYSFLNSRFEQLLQNHNGDLVLCDFHFAKSLWFAKVNLDKRDFKSFRHAFNAMEKHLPLCDLLIYLECRPAHQKKNIASRARKFENNIPSKYLRDIGNSYEEGLISLDIPVLKLTIASYDGNTYKKLETAILKYIKENFG